MMKPSEVADFERRLNGFIRAKPVWVARVPARLDVMGGIADYSGANVCQATLGAGVLAAVQARRDRLVRIRTERADGSGLPAETEFPLEEMEDAAGYESIRARFAAHSLASWAAYAGGSLVALLREEGIRPPAGFTLRLLATAPMNAGIASSAAVEISTLCALNAWLGLGLGADRIAQLGQIAENRVVGAPCGIMDQIAIASGRRGKLVHILCRPGSVEGRVDVPKGTGFVGINSMVRHSVAAAPYGDVRIGAFMGRRILNRLRKQKGLPPLAHLTELSAAELAAEERHLPGQMTGADFLARYRTHEDAATVIRPGTVYRIRAPVRHAVLENERVLRFMEALRSARNGGEAGCAAAGREMLAAHESYRDECRLSVPEVDALVEAVRRIGPRKGLYGAKITGGGAGGTVAVFGRREALKKHIPGIAAEHARRMGTAPDVFGGTSPGAFEFGARRYAPRAGGWTWQAI